MWERDTENMQKVVDQGPRAAQYFSDAFPTYGNLVYYPGKYAVSEGKTDTYSVVSISTRKWFFRNCREAITN